MKVIFRWVQNLHHEPVFLSVWVDFQFGRLIDFHHPKMMKPNRSFVHGEIYFEFIQTKSDYIYHFPMDLDPNGDPFSSKSIGKS